nr:DUF31 family protein [Mycoplasmoides pneumoniae]
MFQDQASLAFGTGWLIDWKDHNSQDKFTAYLATNLHVANSLRNVNDYDPFKYRPSYFDLEAPTESFALGKFVDAIEVKQMALDAFSESSMVSIATSQLPKTAYTATSFIESEYYSFPYLFNDQKYYWDYFDYKIPAADFAVLELELDLNNQQDQQIKDHFIDPAIKAYKQLGDSTGLFATKPLTEYQNDTHYLLGYPVVPTDHTQLWECKQGAERFSYGYFYSNMARLTKNLRQGDPNAGSKTHIEYSNELLDKDSMDQGIVRFSTFLGANINYHDYDYRQQGYGLTLTDTNLPGGSSGSLVFNQDKKISSIYSAATESDSVGYAQLLRTPRDVNGISVVSQSYDLIFGDSNTKRYYAMFAKKQQTHLYSEILKSTDEQYRYVVDKQFN